MGTNTEGDLEIACCASVHSVTALAAKNDSLSVVNTCGNCYRQLLCSLYKALTLTVLTGCFNYLTRAAALFAIAGGLHHTEGSSLLNSHLTAALTVGTGLGACSGCRTAAITIGALLNSLILNILLTAEYCLLKGKSQSESDILAAYGAVLSSLTATAEAAAKAAAENIGEDIGNIKAVKSESASAKAAGCGIEGRVAVLIVLCLLIRIGENVVGLVYFLEVLFSLCVSGVHIGVVLLCKLSVCFFYFIIRSAFIKSQHLVVVSFICHMFPLRFMFVIYYSFFILFKRVKNE